MALPRNALIRIRERLRDDGLNVVLPLERAVLDAVLISAGAPALAALAPDLFPSDRPSGTGGAIIIGDGGPVFFDRFRRATAQTEPVAPGDHRTVRDPLDQYTVVVMERALGELAKDLEIPKARLFFPFVRALTGDQPSLPFQRLGIAAGLPPPGPLGIQVHPTYGPWWAYRALAVFSVPMTTEPSLPAPCEDCARPCIATCPVSAVQAEGFVYSTCRDFRTGEGQAMCRRSCAARLACPVGTGHRYPAGQLAFHMEASFPTAQLS